MALSAGSGAPQLQHFATATNATKMCNMLVTWHLIFRSILDLKFGFWPEKKPL